MNDSFLQKIAGYFREKPFRPLAGYMAVSAVLWTLQCSLLQNILSVDAVEALFWGAEHALGHSKHPPLSGWIAELASLTGGRGDWASYLACQICILVNVHFVYRTVRLFADRYFASASAGLLYFLYYYLPSWMKFSTYFVEMALSGMTAFWFFKALRKGRWYFWALFGACCGLGILNKYSFALQILAYVIIFFSVPEYRKKVFTAGPWIAGSLAVLLVLPHLRWLVQNDFCCLRHVGNRLEEKRHAFECLATLGYVLYPLFNAFMVLLVCRFPILWKNRKTAFFKSLFPLKDECMERPRRLLLWTSVLTLVPSLAFWGIELAGGSVIGMWYCSIASWTGAMILALFPVRVTPALWKRMFLLLILVSVIVYIAAAADLMFRSSMKLHAVPKAITGPAMKYWRSRCGTRPVPVVAGSRWLAGVIHNYTPGRPPVCEALDPFYYCKYRDKIRREGALLIGDQEDMQDMEKTFGVKIETVCYGMSYHSLFGRERTSGFLVGVIMPADAGTVK